TCPVRCDLGAGVLVRITPGRLADGGEASPAGAGEAGRSRSALSARGAPAGNLSLQACPHSGCSVSIVAQEQTATVSPPDCPGIGGALSGDPRHPARTARVSLHGGQSQRAGHPVLAAGGGASEPALGPC